MRRRRFFTRSLSLKAFFVLVTNLHATSGLKDFLLGKMAIDRDGFVQFQARMAINKIFDEKALESYHLYGEAVFRE